MEEDRKYGKLTEAYQEFPGGQFKEGNPGRPRYRGWDSASSRDLHHEFAVSSTVAEANEAN